MKKIRILILAAFFGTIITAFAQPKPAQPVKRVTPNTSHGHGEVKPKDKAPAQPPAAPLPPDGQLPPKQGKWKAAPISGWYIHYDEAVRAAKKANKKIFVLNAGSDWDPASVSLRKSVLDTRDFQQIAKRSLILLYLDNPQKFPLPDEQTRHHDIIRGRFQLAGKKTPSAVIIEPNGKIICEINGVLPKNEYLDKIRTAVAGSLGHK
ncbi:MAG: thioredoxin family protein [Lentisphaeria bacterium]|nr:thioredoxin family protein [Victivallales bacterium]MCR4573066.1 thioredoxin family protein [Lentisphaeria bacterium]